MSALTQHPLWPRLTDDQRECVNRVWDDLVVPALESVDVMRRERDAALLALQDKDLHSPLEHCIGLYA